MNFEIDLSKFRSHAKLQMKNMHTFMGTLTYSELRWFSTNFDTMVACVSPTACVVKVADHTFTFYNRIGLGLHFYRKKFLV